MEQQLKSLKVVDLKAILAKANVQVSSKANKTDLIAKILSSHQAIDVYKSIHVSDELLAPPADVDWKNEQEFRPANTIQSPAPASAPAPAPTPLATEEKRGKVVTPTITSNSATNSEDEETAKRRRRAERFGIPFVETPRSQSARVATRLTPDDLVKLEARAARFGITHDTVQERQGVAGTIDTEEEGKRRKRAERFGIPP